MANKANFLDKVVLAVAPQAGLERMRARQAANIVKRHYEGASAGRRTQGWSKVAGDANSVNSPALGRLRDVARDLERNNPWAGKGLRAITGNVVGWGITAKPANIGANALKRWNKAWAEWSESTQCDYDGQLTMGAMQRKVMHCVARDGEVLVRRHYRTPADKLAIPLQLQLLEADFLDTSKTLDNGSPAGNFIIQGVEFNAKGQRVAYWLHTSHPGNQLPTYYNRLTSVRIDAAEIIHVFRPDRPGQVRGVSWFAPVVLRMKDYDEYEDATLLRQKIAACFVGFVTNVDGAGTAITTPSVETPDSMEEMQPGFMKYLKAGENVEFGESPAVSEFDPYSKSVLRGIAAGMGVTYEQLTGDYSNVNYSSARMARYEQQNNIEEWQYHLLIPMFCTPVFNWATLAALLAGVVGERPTAEWMPPPMKMLEPDKEARAMVTKVRGGLQTLTSALRELGIDPDKHFDEFAEDLAKLDKLGIILDTDPRKTTQAGNPREQVQKPGEPAAGGKGA